MSDIVIVAAARTAVGKFGGTLAKTPASELGATVIKALLERANVLRDAVASMKLRQGSADEASELLDRAWAHVAQVGVEQGLADRSAALTQQGDKVAGACALHRRDRVDVQPGVAGGDVAGQAVGDDDGGHGGEGIRDRARSGGGREDGVRGSS